MKTTALMLMTSLLAAKVCLQNQEQKPQENKTTTSPAQKQFQLNDMYWPIGQSDSSTVTPPTPPQP